MSEFQGEKTEQPTQRRLEDAIKQGQFARSTEVQTVVVLLAGLLALMFTGRESWRLMTLALGGTLGHLHEFAITQSTLQGQAIHASLFLAQCIWPVVLAVVLAGLLAGGIQTRFQTAEEALGLKWERINPAAGFKRIFSVRAATPAIVSVVKITVIVALSYSQVRSIMEDPIFYTTVSAERLAVFMADTAFGIILRVCGAMAVIAAADYGYQFWRNHQDLMMTKEEVKEESKSNEGNPQVKSRMRRMRQSVSQRKMLQEVPKADVILTNPTRLAIALRYDRKTMRAPRIVAKGSRLNAARIREIAKQHQIPIVENKPLARMIFKYGRVGGEIPAQLYAAVAEILAWVYRVNRYRYYTEQNHPGT
jgi:flagellar biosynthesis protein FlhB